MYRLLIALALICEAGAQVRFGNQAMLGSVNTSAVMAPPQAAGYLLNFSDDFTTLSLSPTGLGSAGSFNWYPSVWYHSLPPLANITVSNSILNLLWQNGQSGSANDTSITTFARDASHYRAWRYGYFESRFKWPAGTTGAWPAFWMIPIENGNAIGGAGTPETGEFDIEEGQGANPQTFYFNVHDWVSGSDIANLSPNNLIKIPPDQTQYHTFGMLWTPGTVKWYVDNNFITSASTYAVMDTQEYYLILGMQIGANFTPGSNPGSVSSLTMNVDWVRVWLPPGNNGYTQ